MGEFNLLKQFVSFHQRRELYPLNANEMALYFLLLDRANRCFFPEWLPLGGAFVQEELCLSRWAFDQARNSLIAKGYLKYRAGTRGRKPAYHVIPLYEAEDCKALDEGVPVSVSSSTQQQSGTKTSTISTPSPTQSQHQNQHDPGIITSTIPTLKPTQSQHQNAHNPDDTFYKTKTETKTEKEKPPKGGKKKKPDIPDELSPAMKASLSDWLDYKANRGNYYTPKGWEAFIAILRKRIAEHSEQAVIDVIQLSMSREWQGVALGQLKKGGAYEPQQRNPTSPGQPVCERSTSGFPDTGDI